jgi:predicted nucleotidyltransferase
MNKKLIEKLNEYFKNKAHIYGIEAAFMFGSTAEGAGRSDSDIDIAVYFGKEVSFDEYFKVITDISMDIERIVKREIDVVWIDKDFSKPMLYFNAIVKGIPIFYKNKDVYISLFLRALYEKEDFCRLGVLWQKEIAKRRLKRIK